MIPVWLIQVLHVLSTVSAAGVLVWLAVSWVRDVRGTRRDGENGLD